MNKQNMKPEYKLRQHSSTYNYIIIYYKKIRKFLWFNFSTWEQLYSPYKSQHDYPDYYQPLMFETKREATNWIENHNSFEKLNQYIQDNKNKYNKWYKEEVNRINLRKKELLK